MRSRCLPLLASLLMVFVVWLSPLQAQRNPSKSKGGKAALSSRGMARPFPNASRAPSRANKSPLSNRPPGMIQPHSPSRPAGGLAGPPVRPVKRERPTAGRADSLPGGTRTATLPGGLPNRPPQKRPATRAQVTNRPNNSPETRTPPRGMARPTPGPVGANRQPTALPDRMADSRLRPKGDRKTVPTTGQLGTVAWPARPGNRPREKGVPRWPNRPASSTSLGGGLPTSRPMPSPKKVGGKTRPSRPTPRPAQVADRRLASRPTPGDGKRPQRPVRFPGQIGPGSLPVQRPSARPNRPGPQFGDNGGYYGGGGHWGSGRWGNNEWITNNNYYRQNTIHNNNYFGPSWSGAHYGNWYRGSWKNDYWSGFATGALTSWGTAALVRPNYVYARWNYLPMAWNVPVYGNWGLGKVASNWLYTGYANPYVTSFNQTVVVQVPVQPNQAARSTRFAAHQRVVVHDYAKPIDTTQPPPELSEAELAQKVFESARESFVRENYGNAH